MISPSNGFHTRFKFRLIGFVIVVSILCTAYGQNSAVSGLSLETGEHVKRPGWWPTKGTAALSEYAGSAACARCHRSISASQAQTPMFNAASRPAEASVLRQHDNLQFSEGDYGYKLTRVGNQTVFLVENTWGTLSAPVAWAIGNGEVGQTYLLKKNDTYFESRLSYFPGLSGLDITPGHSHNLPNDLEQAVGMPQDPATAKLCFGCHTTASNVSGVFNPEDSTPGIHCEACHGPSAEHVKAEEHGSDSVATPFNPADLAPHDSVDFCGACHRTPADVGVQMPGNIGMIGIRFSAYRLERSLCWGASGDARITCIACHDPHKPLEKDLASYDSKCLQCHANTGHRARANQAAACTVASKDCVSCHMPKYEFEMVHATFTDHYIRIVRAGSGYRD